jgi:LysM repeat protein
MKKFPILLPLVLLTFTAAAAPADLAKEYEQVKKIALRDPKVRAAYDDADRRLAAKIVEIDPTLKGYVPGKRLAASETKPTATAAPRKPAGSTPRQASTYQHSHVVAKGDTVSSIAAKYHVTVDELRRINDIKNDKKLPVGQVLAIPNNGGKPQPKKKKDAGWWDRVKSSF